MVIFLNNVEKDLLESALYNHFINLNSTILYKYLDGNILAIEVKHFSWRNKNLSDFCLDDFINNFRNVILHIDHKTTLS